MLFSKPEFMLFSTDMDYRIGLIALLAAGMLAAAPQSGSTHKQADDPDVKEMRDYRLNLDVIGRYVTATKAMMQGAAVSCFKDHSPGDAPTLDAGQKIIEACPAAVSNLKAQGLKPREFLIISASLVGDFMAVGLKKQGTIKAYPPSISPENAAFVEQNYEKLKAMLAPLMGTGDK